MRSIVKKYVRLATAGYYQKFHYINCLIANVPIRYRAGGRCGTIACSLEAFADRVGHPHNSLPREYWRDYTGDGIDGAGKITALWLFETPRGPVEVSDYWWNGPEELSVRAPDWRALRWFSRWCKLNNIPWVDKTNRKDGRSCPPKTEVSSSRG